MNKRVVLFAAIIGLLVFVAYLIAGPIPIEPVAWQSPQYTPLEGDYASNSLLAEAAPAWRLPSPGPEDIAVWRDGRVVTGLENGDIVLLRPGSSEIEVIARTGGRPLGMKFDADDRLIVADAEKGLLRIALTGEIEVLVARAEGVEFADDLDISVDGTIYFSDASSKFSRHQIIEALAEHGPYGRLLAYRPDTGQLKVLLDGLYFANGVALAADESYVLVSESVAARVRRYWLKGSRAGQDDIFIADLPGYPDNINRGETADYWLAIPQPRSRLVSLLSASPLLSRVLYRLAGFPGLLEASHPIVIGLDSDGVVTANLQDDTGQYSGITSAMEYDGALLLGSLAHPAVLRFDLLTEDL